MPINRQEVYDAINTERNYQCEKWGYLDSVNSVGDFLAYMKRYLDMAFVEVNPKAQYKVLELVRKITALGVACMEKHGAPKR